MSKQVPPKKRNRISLSCSYCKKRKVRCDRGRPCSSCVKYNAANDCHYPGFEDGVPSADIPVSEMSKKPLFMVNEANEQRNTNTNYMIPDQSLSYTQNSPVSNVMKFDSMSQNMHTKDKSTRNVHIQSSNNMVSSNSESSVMAELEALKGKIKQLEKNISNGHNSTFSTLEDRHKAAKLLTSNNLPPPSIVAQNSSSLEQLVDNRFNKLSPSSNTNTPFTLGTTPVLPPISWSPMGSSENILSSNTPSDLCFISRCRGKYCHRNPYGSIDDQFSLYGPIKRLIVHSSNLRQNHGVFTWISFIARDKGVRILWERFHNKKLNPIKHVFEKGTLLKATETGDSPTTEENEENFQTRAAIYVEVTDLKPLNNNGVEKRSSGKLRPKFIDNDDVRMKRHQQALTLGLVNEPSVNKDLELAEQIVKVLPQKKIVWLLIHKFFKTVYPFMPFLDQEVLLSEWTRIIGSENLNMEDFQHLNVEKRLDYAYIGILLVVLRFTYLSLFSNIKEVNENNLRTQNTSERAQEVKLILSNPITLQVIDMAQLCVDKFDIHTKSSLEILQLMQILRIYHIFGPEEGDGADGNDSQVTNSMIVQTAYQMGVNREPEFYDPDGDEKTNNLLRKLWFFIVINDIVQSYQYGNAMSISPKYYDTRLPFYRKGNENIPDVDMEKDVLSSFRYFERYYRKTLNILDILLDHTRRTNVKEVSDLLTDYELFVSNTFGIISDFMVPFEKDTFNYSFLKVMKCKNYLNLTNFIVSISSSLQFHFENTRNWEAMVFYMKKVITISIIGLVPFYNELISNNHVNFGEAADLILNPSIIATIHKASLYIISLLVRVNAVVHQFKCSSTHNIDLQDNYYRSNFQKYCKLSKSLQLCLKYVIASVSRLSNRYYYAWRVSKSHNYLHKLVTGNALYDESDYSSVVEDFKQLPISSIDELTLMFEQTLELINNRKVRRKYVHIAQDSPPNNNAEQDHVFFEDFEYSPHSNNTDPAYHDIVNNKEIDELWTHMASEFGKDYPDLLNDPTNLLFELGNDLFQTDRNDNPSLT